MFAFAKNLVTKAEGYINTANEQYDQHAVDPAEPVYGFRVLHVSQNSAASEAGIEALFDFVIGLNGHELATQTYNNQPEHYNSGRSRSASGALQPDFTTSDAVAPVDSFMEEIRNCKGRSVTLEVWSAKGRIRRFVMLPIDESAADDSTSFGLGMSLQWTPLAVADHVWHILNVAPNSPAEQAGLISHADYIVGAENGLLESGGESLLGRIVSKMVASYQNDPPQPRDGPPPEIELYVYNHDYDTLRPVRIRPNNSWGGTGLLGCGVGYGLLHRLPAVAGKYDTNSPPGHRRSSSIYGRRTESLSVPNHGIPPGGTLFEAEEAGSEKGEPVSGDTSTFIMPANMASHVPQVNDGTATSPVSKPRKKHVAHTLDNQSNEFKDYFAEEEKKSRELEGRSPANGASSTATSLPPPPPPKAKSSVPPPPKAK